MAATNGCSRITPEVDLCGTDGPTVGARQAVAADSRFFRSHIGASLHEPTSMVVWP